MSIDGQSCFSSPDLPTDSVYTSVHLSIAEFAREHKCGRNLKTFSLHPGVDLRLWLHAWQSIMLTNALSQSMDQQFEMHWFMTLLFRCHIAREALLSAIIYCYFAFLKLLLRHFFGGLFLQWWQCVGDDAWFSPRRLAAAVIRTKLIRLKAVMSKSND